MPAPTRFRFYKGQPVKRMREVSEGLKLTMLSPIKGEAGEQFVVTQAEWDTYGEWRAFPYIHMDAMRELVTV